MSERIIKVFVADDHALVREVLCQCLRASGFAVVGEAATGHQAIDRIPAADPDVAVLDLVMPGMSGIEAARWLRENRPRTEIVILTGHHNETYQRQAFESGARGYVLKDGPYEQLLEAIRSAARGDYYLAGPEGRGDVVADYAGPWVSRQKPGGVITQRERELAILLADGYSSKEAASVLNISVKTADTHRASLMRKLGAKNVADVVKYCLRNRLIEP